MYRSNSPSLDPDNQFFSYSVSNDIRHRRLQREKQLAELNTAFNSLISEAEEKHEFIYENVFTEHGEVHDKSKIQSVQESMNTSDSKTKFGNNASREEFHDHVIDYLSHNVHKSGLLKKRGKFIILFMILLSSITLGTIFALRKFAGLRPTEPELSIEVLDAYRLIQGALIDMGVNQVNFNNYASIQYQAAIFLAEEAVMSETNLNVLEDQELIERADDGEIINFNLSYMQKRELSERFSLLTLWYSTNDVSHHSWRTSSNWASNTSICTWYGIRCLQVQNQELTMSLVTIIDLSDNQLYGKIPDEISLLRDVHTIHFQNNYLTGGIPESLGNLSYLSKFHLLQNTFQGQMPSSICRLRSDYDGYLNSLVADCGGNFACLCCTVCL